MKMYDSWSVSRKITELATENFYEFLDALSRCGKFISCNALPSTSSFAKERISLSSCRAYSTRRYIPIATVGAPFSMRDTFFVYLHSFRLQILCFFSIL